MNALAPIERTSLEPKTIDEAMRFATLLAKSTMVPRDYVNKPENILVAVAWGREIGLGTLQALQNIAVINGRPSIYGDAMLALVRGSGLCSYVHESIEGDGDGKKAVCRTLRKGEPKETVGEFSIADAKKASLWAKSGPWSQYPDRMLKMRARSFALRDAYADVLRGVIAAEEAQDISPEPHRGPTIEHSEPPADNRIQTGSPAESTPSAREAINAAVPLEPKPRAGRMTIADWLTSMETALKDAGTDRVQVDRVLFDARNMQIAQTLRNGALQRYNQAKAEAIQRANPAPPPDEEVPEDDADADTWPGPDVRTPLPA